MARANEFRHPRFIIVVIVLSLLARTGHARLNDHERHNDRKKVDGSDDPHHDVRRIAVTWRQRLWFDRWFEGLFVVAERGSVDPVPAVIDDEAHTLLDLVPSPVGGTNGNGMRANLKVPSRDLHVRREAPIVSFNIGNTGQIRPRCGNR